MIGNDFLGHSKKVESSLLLIQDGSLDSKEVPITKRVQRLRPE